MSGYVGDLSSKQDEKLAKFKETLKDVLKPEHDDHLLLRFLRARNFDVDKSETLFRKDLEWRDKIGINKIKESFESPEACKKYWPGGFVGYDKEGAPVWIEPMGMSDPKGLLHSCQKSDILKHQVSKLENFIKMINEQTKKLDKPIPGLTYIIDMDGLGRHHLWKPGIDLYNQVNLTLQDHYPECLKVVFIINAPKVFPLVYALCRPVLNSNIRRKIHILGSDWREVLLNCIDADVLPVHWGGNVADPDGNPMCPSKICLGGEVPKSYYFQEVNFQDELMTERIIKRGSMLEFKYNVTKSGCLFRYAFKTVDHDIAFGIKRIDSNGQKVKILETNRVNSHYVLQEGQVELETPGYYVFKFDNTFSWTKPKRIMYMLELLEPVGNLDEEKVATNLNKNNVIENEQNIVDDNKSNGISKGVENGQKVEKDVEENIAKKKDDETESKNQSEVNEEEKEDEQEVDKDVKGMKDENIVEKKGDETENHGQSEANEEDVKQQNGTNIEKDVNDIKDENIEEKKDNETENDGQSTANEEDAKQQNGTNIEKDVNDIKDENIEEKKDNETENDGQSTAKEKDVKQEGGENTKEDIKDMKDGDIKEKNGDETENNERHVVSKDAEQEAIDGIEVAAAEVKDMESFSYPVINEANAVNDAGNTEVVGEDVKEGMSEAQNNGKKKDANNGVMNEVMQVKENIIETGIRIIEDDQYLIIENNEQKSYKEGSKMEEVKNENTSGSKEEITENSGFEQQVILV